MMGRWLQIQGDPAVRQFLFEQRRVDNAFDRELDRVLARLRVLITTRGVFHAKIRFSTGEVALWFLTDPWRYRVHLMDEFLSHTVCRRYPRVPYPHTAFVPMTGIDPVLAEFKRLRFQDPQVYLRSASLNIMSGTVSLRFSCDGAHYLDYTEFLARAGEI